MEASLEEVEEHAQPYTLIGAEQAGASISRLLSALSLLNAATMSTSDNGQRANSTPFRNTAGEAAPIFPGSAHAGWSTSLPSVTTAAFPELITKEREGEGRGEDDEWALWVRSIPGLKFSSYLCTAECARSSWTRKQASKDVNPGVKRLIALTL